MIFKLIYFIFLFMVFYNVIFLTNTAITKQEYFSIFGISFIISEDNYMKPEITKNSLVITYNISENKLEEGQNISYVVNGKIKTSKIVNKNTSNGKITFTTKSNALYYNNIEEVTYKMIIGKEICSIWELGFIIKIAQTKIFSVICLIFLVLKFLYNKNIYQENRKRRNKKKKLENEI